MICYSDAIKALAGRNLKQLLRREHPIRREAGMVVYVQSERQRGLEFLERTVRTAAAAIPQGTLSASPSARAPISLTTVYDNLHSLHVLETLLEGFKILITKFLGNNIVDHGPPFPPAHHMLPTVCESRTRLAMVPVLSWPQPAEQVAGKQ